MFEPARAVTAAAFNTIGVTLVGMATAANTDALPVLGNADALTAAAELGRRLRDFSLAGTQE